MIAWLPMAHEGISRAVSALGVEIVELLTGVLGGRWAAAVIPFTRVRMGTSEVDVVLPSAVDLEGIDQSLVLREATPYGSDLRKRFAYMATVISMQLDAAGIAWDWGAVRVRRTPEGNTRAGLELGKGLPPMRPLEILGQPTMIPPPMADPQPARPSFLPPPPALPQIMPAGPDGRARLMSLPVLEPPPEEDVEADEAPPASSFFADEETPILPQEPPPAEEDELTTTLNQPELVQTMNRAQTVLGPKQAAFGHVVVRHGAVHLSPRERSVEFQFAGQPSKRFGCDQVAVYLPSEARWEWGWAVDAWHPLLRSQSEKLRKTAGNWNLRALATPRLTVNPEAARRLAMTAAWILGASAYHFVGGEAGGETVIAVYGAG